MFEIEQIIRAMNQIFEAGIAITALSLFIRSLSFRLSDRVSRSFAVVLACVMVIFSGEAISGALGGGEKIVPWLQLQWVGILFLPPAFQHFSDALLETTGRPSRGRRRLLVIGSYLVSVVFLGLLVAGRLLGPVDISGGPFPYLTATVVTYGFVLYYLGSAVFSGIGIWRAYRRTRLRVSRRRITYLLIGVIFLAIGAFPYTQLGSDFAQGFPTIFTLLVILGNIGIFLVLLLMAYAVAFFGVPWPDRLVRTRLLKWVLRGPISVFMMLFLITLTNELVEEIGTPYIVAVPIVSVVSVLLAEHSITLLFPHIERWLLQSGERDHYYLLQRLSERLISSGDLQQFLEAVLAGVCDQFQVSTGFVAAADEGFWEVVVSTNDLQAYELGDVSESAIKKQPVESSIRLFSWGDFWVIPLELEQSSEMIGMIGVLRREGFLPDRVVVDAIRVLSSRAEMALQDRSLQRQVFRSLEELGPKIELLQRLRASFRFDQNEILKDMGDLQPTDEEINQWVKDAFSHYWGGPKLTGNPLLELQIVQDALKKNGGPAVNALRAILRGAMERIRPEGDRQFTSEWTLYNILEMKFVEGRKVRDVAKRLSVSEADLYRKQRVAIEAVANTIIEMEMQARQS